MPHIFPLSLLCFGVLGTLQTTGVCVKTFLVAFDTRLVSCNRHAFFHRLELSRKRFSRDRLTRKRLVAVWLMKNKMWRDTSLWRSSEICLNLTKLLLATRTTSEQLSCISIRGETFYVSKPLVAILYISSDQKCKIE